MEQPRYRFTAFISYKRGEDDEKFAKWLQTKLESFRIPTEIAPPADSVAASRRFRVFRDKTDLGSHAELNTGLHKSLEQCRFLIVVCSPRSAGSPYVDAEARWFLDNGRADSIIPFIISGTPAPREGEEQCYPPSLGPEALGITLAEGSREEALIKVVARLLLVDFSFLYQRHLRAQRRFMAKIAAGLAAVLFLVAGLALWAVNAERRAVAQREEAEALVRFMTFDIRDEAFQYIPVKAREQITRKVEDYYRRWGAISLEARYVQAVHQRNLFLRLFEAGDNSGAEALLPDILAKIGALRKELPDDVELMRLEVTTRFVKSTMAAMRRGNLEEDLAETEYGIDLAQEVFRKRPDDPEALRVLARMEENAASAFSQAGNHDQSLRHAEAAVARRRDLAARYPQNAEYEKEYLEALDTLCSSLSSAGRDSPLYDEVITAFRRASAADPHNLELRFMLTGALHNKTHQLISTGRLDEARPLHRENFEVHQDLLARDPDNTSVRTKFAAASALEALFRLQEGRPYAEVAAMIREAENDLARVAEKDRDNLQLAEAQQALSFVKSMLGSLADQEE